MPNAQTSTSYVQTVLGRMSPGDLGPTMMHEHIFVDITSIIEELPGAAARARQHEPIRLDNLGWVRQNYMSHYSNLLLADIAIAVAELRDFKEWGGGTIVDVTPIGIGRDPQALARASRSAGVHIVMSTGYYVEATHPPEVKHMTEAALTTTMIRELQEGVVESRGGVHDDCNPEHRDTGVKAGIIKIGCSWPLSTSERKVLCAAVRAQAETGAAITVHTGRDEKSPLEIIAALDKAGADLTRVVMGHLDLRVQTVDVLRRIADSGCYLEWDLFGLETSYYPFTNADMPSDGQRIDVVNELIADGHRDRCLISHDIAHNHRLRHFGGHGYKHILETVVPFMRKKGVSQEDIDAILVANPARVLSIGENRA
jgi:phosphotriesterase-related protein